MTPGIYGGISNEKYHKGDGISSSMLRILADKSPAHLKATMDASNDNAPTGAAMLGTVFHSFMLEPATFDQQYVVAPSVDRRTKAGKEAFDSFVRDLNGQTVITDDINEQIEAMRQSVLNHPAAWSLMYGTNSISEVSVYATDPITGLLRRARPDRWRCDGIVVDLKTTEDASPEGFARSAAKYGYPMQAAYYLDTLNLAEVQCGTLGFGAKQFALLVVEKTPPYAVEIYVLDQVDLDIGRAKYVAALRQYAECLQSGEWPAYGRGSVQKLEMPAFWRKSNERFIGGV